MELGSGPSALTFLLLDANARVGSVGAACFGTCDAAKENKNGGLFRSFLLTNKLVACNTFSECGYTWRSAMGTTARIDYICIPAIRLDCVESCYVPESVDLSLQAKEDHRPVAAALNIEALAQSSSCSQLPKRQQPACRINKYNLNDPVRRGRFEEELWKYRSPWHVPLEDHLDHWNKYLTRTAVKHFGKPQDRPRKPWISPSTWAIVRARSSSPHYVQGVDYRARVTAATGVAGVAIAQEQCIHPRHGPLRHSWMGCSSAVFTRKVDNASPCNAANSDLRLLITDALSHFATHSPG